MTLRCRAGSRAMSRHKLDPVGEDGASCNYPESAARARFQEAEAAAIGGSIVLLGRDSPDEADQSIAAPARSTAISQVVMTTGEWMVMKGSDSRSRIAVESNPAVPGPKEGACSR